MRRGIIRGGLILVALLVVAILLLATSGSVARYLVNRGAAAVPGLSLEYQHGNLWRGVGLAAVRYEGPGLLVTADRLLVRWSLHCLASGSFCLDRVAIDGAVVETTPVPGPPEAPDGAVSMPVLPVDILFRQVEVNGLRVTSPGTEVSVSAIRLRGSLTNAGLKIETARVTDPLVRVTGPSDGIATEEPARVPVELPAFQSPLAVDVARLRVERPVLETAEGRNEAQLVRFDGGIEGARLNIERFEVEHERGRARLSGRLRLVGGYPVSLQLEGTAPALYRGRPQRVAAKLSGSVASLGVKATLDGVVDARLDGQLQPLRPEVPYSLTVRASAIGWPLGEKAQQVRGTDLRVQLNGDLDGYTVSGSGGLSGTATPALDWRLEARGDWQQARIEQLALRGLDGSARISGQVSWAPAVTWQASVEAEGLQLDRRWPQAPGDLGGTAEVQGAVSDGGWRLEVDTPGVDASYRGQPVTVAGNVRHTLEGEWRFPQVRVTNGANRVTANGSLDGGLAVTAELDLAEPGRWVAGLDGGFTGTMTVKGPLTTPDIDLDVIGRGLAYQGVRVEEARLEGRVERLAAGSSRVSLHLGGSTYGERALDNLRLTVAGTRERHGLTLQASGEGAAVELMLQGGLTADQNWDGQLADGAIAWAERRWILQEPAPLFFDSTALEARMAEHCWARQDTRLCLTKPARFGRSGEVAVALADMPLGWLSQWLPEGFNWTGRLSGDIGADWSPQRAPTISVALISRDGSLTVADGDATSGGAAALPLGYERLSLDANLDPERLRAKVELQSTTLGGASADLRLRHAEPGRPVSGRVDIEGVGLAVFEPFFPRIETLQGQLALGGSLGGSLASPTFDGELTLRDGEIKGPELPMHVRDLSLTVGVSGRQARIEGGFNSGEGEAEITGDATWDAAGWSLEAQLTGERLRVQYAPVAVLQVSPDLRLEAGPEAVVLDGVVRVPEGDLTLKQLPKGAVPYSTDVVVVRGPGARQQSEADGAAGLQISTRIEVVLGEAVRFSGLGAEGRLTGGLRLRQIGTDTAEGTGEIRIVDASFEAYGQELDIRSGRLIFAGPVTEPLVEIEAIRRIDTVVVGLRVEGPATQPEVSLFSEPPMPEEQVLAYLVTGRAYGEAGPEGDAAMAQAAVALGVFTSRGAASDIASELGVEDFQLAAEGEGEGAQVTVSGYIAPNLLVKYGVGVFTPNNTLTLRYNVTRNVYLEAVSGLESAIDAFYSFSF